jgi:hypothetical protein
MKTPEDAFNVFTKKIDRWWPKTRCVGESPIHQSYIEPFVGCRRRGSTLSASHKNLRTWLNRMNSCPNMVSTTWERVASIANAAWPPNNL